MATLLSTQPQKTPYYQTDQQVKYLHLEAEVDMLLQRLTSLKKQQRLLAEVSQKLSE